MPVVTVSPIPNGFPIARTRSPTSTLPLEAKVMAGRSLADTFTTAMSVCGSRPTTPAPRLQLAAVGQRAHALLGPVDDVVVRDDVAVGADDHTRAEPGFGALRHDRNAVAEELAEERVVQARELGAVIATAERGVPVADLDGDLDDARGDA